MSEKPRRAKPFYGVIVVGVIIGVVMDLLKIDPIKALFWSAILNGIAAVPLIAVIVWLASNSRSCTSGGVRASPSPGAGLAWR